METSLRRVAGAGVCLSVSAPTLITIESFLERLSALLCPDAASASFRFGYSRVILAVLPVLALDPVLPSPDPRLAARFALQAALSGTLEGLLVMSSRIGRFILLPAWNRRA